MKSTERQPKKSAVHTVVHNALFLLAHSSLRHRILPIVQWGVFARDRTLAREIKKLHINEEPGRSTSSVSFFYVRKAKTSVKNGTVFVFLGSMTDGLATLHQHPLDDLFPPQCDVVLVHYARFVRVSQYAQDFVQSIEHAGLKNVFLWGFSMGSAVVSCVCEINRSKRIFKCIGVVYNSSFVSGVRSILASHWYGSMNTDDVHMVKFAALAQALYTENLNKCRWRTLWTLKQADAVNLYMTGRDKPFECQTSSCLEKWDINVPVIIFSSYSDKIVHHMHQVNMFHTLRKAGANVSLFTHEAPGTHGHDVYNVDRVRKITRQKISHWFASRAERAPALSQHGHDIDVFVNVLADCDCWHESKDADPERLPANVFDERLHKTTAPVLKHIFLQ